MNGKDVDDMDIARLLLDGLTQAEVGELVGMTQTGIRERIRSRPKLASFRRRPKKNRNTLIEYETRARAEGISYGQLRAKEWLNEN